ncbi:hypothetical protein TEA_006524 [Camellia sinensis var. sinensis]|uniref:Receptor-like serine/threonine-protein kinase n=1 Tax=Camellia sinensis var. sinensis TaxID=542762 RepID=A0A4S4DXY4_CAMSN|nr:hypothetical protein TEA_006524 [Camellia sinensis var. sinensis]
MDSITNLLLSSFLCSILVVSTTAVNTISATQSIKDGDTIVSIGGSFTLGFFSPGSSKNRYAGIWYNKISNDSRTVVWVVNRETPVTDSSGILMVTQQGVLVLLNSTESIIWSSNLTKPRKNPVAELLESGNLVLRNADDDNPENYLWQSFDYPTDTFLPGMKFGIHYETGLNMSLWKDTVKVFRSGPWNGVRFSGMPTISSNPIYNFTFVLNQNETYFNYDLLNSSVVTRMVMNQDGVLRRMTWIEGSSTSWVEHLTTEMTNCDTVAFCGPYGLCTVSNSPECGCLQGFEPKFPKDWGTDWSNGMTLKGCETICLKKCSCMAYANLDVSGEGSGCLLWFNELVDIRVIENGQDLYVRMAASEFGQASHNWNKAKMIIVISVVSTATLILGLAISLYIWKKKEWQKREGRTIGHPEQGYYKESKNEDIELPLFHLVTITKATDNFAINNKLGEGRFGPVYKLLSKDSKQGVDEFNNEVICIAKLQHRNLVKLLGYCIQGEERMLIYEFMPNNNLDSFIFDQSQKMLLDWPKRFHIINGTVRGLLYLHQDSRLRIIHRDLKGSNILLDYEMNPKISDFGLARIFGANETQANTRRVVGTYGYMSPEYAIEGLFSVKFDVFSFGVLVLEIVSGKRNRGFYHQDHHLNLLGHAWRLYKEDRTRELIDEPIQNSCNIPEVLRSIHVGLLCVQQRSEDRPNMASVVLMLGREGALTHPKQPGFFTERNLLEVESTGSEVEQCSTNMVSTTVVEAR